MLIKDQLERIISLPKVPKRIVSLVPSQTELLVDLGLEEQIVGITKFCIYPNHLKKEKQIVGGTKSVHYDKIKALQPDIILCNKEENTKDIVLGLEHIAPIHISDINTLEDCFELIKQYGHIFQKETKANQIINSIKAEKHSFISNRKNNKVAYFIWKNPWMVAGGDTFINTMLEEAGFENIFKNELRYPEIDLLNPKVQLADYIFLSSEPYPFKEKHIKEIKDRLPNKKILLVDGEYFSWYGSRIKDAYKYFRILK